jgi:hypothetical protein
VRSWLKGSRQRGSWLLDVLSRRRFEVLATALDAVFALASQLAAGFRFAGLGSALPQGFAEESVGSHEPGAYVEDHSLEAPKAVAFGLGRQDHVLALLERRRRRG